jgi:3D (Asp-Asp-Asp) domain-containing protein
MFRKNAKQLIVVLLTIGFVSSISASPLKTSLDASQKKEIEVAYRLLLKGKVNKTTKVDTKNHISKVSSETYNKRLHVTATAYTSHVGQTDSTPNIAAWGDRLRPGMKVIAVSRDLLHQYGLKHKQKVRIKGLKGEYLVLDKMNKRWRKKIDIYMGMNKRKAFSWGRRKVEILWNEV